MKQETSEPASSISETELGEIKHCIDHYLSTNDLQSECDVQVDSDQKWWVLEGQIDSFRTKTEIFGLVPEVSGARWIIDRLKIGSTLQNDS